MTTLVSFRTHAVTAMILGSMAASAVIGLSLPGTEHIVEPDNPVSDNGTTTRFGSSVALGGNVLVVGSLDDVTAGGSDRGAVYVFERINGVWTQQEKLVAPDGEDDDEFGHAVDVALAPPGLDDFLIVGAPEARRIDAGPDGKVYLFRRVDGGSWTFESQLFPDPATEVPSSNFGHGVAIDVSVPVNSQTGDPVVTAVVGSPRYEHPTTGGDNHGAVHIYQLVGSPQSFQLTHEFYGHDPQSNQNSGMMLGWSVALDRGLIVAGAPGYIALQHLSGAGFLYGRQNQLPGGSFHWAEGSRLEASAASQQDFLGRSAALSFDTFVGLIGTELYDGVGSNSGAVHVFDLSTFALVRNEVQVLLPSDDAAANAFGTSVDVDGRYAVVGAPGSDVGNLDGAVYLFEQTTGAPDSWVEVGKISPSDLGVGYDDVGAASAISASGLTTAYGVTQRAGSNPTNEGAVYVNELFVEADLGISKTADRTVVANGDLVTYTVVAANPGPDGVTGAAVTDLVPGDLISVSWTCAGTGGATCTGAGTMDVDDTVDLPVAGAVTYTIEGTVDTSALSFDNTAEVAAPPEVLDDTSANDSATVTVLVCGGAANDTVPNQDVTSTELYSAVDTLTAADVDVLTGGDLTLRACGTVILESGFSVQGGRLTVQGGSP